MIDVQQFITNLNNAWLHQRYDKLHEYFHEDVIMVPSQSGQAISGVESMVQSYRKFGSMGVVHDFKIIDLNSFDFGNVIMCHLEFEIDFEIEESRYQEKGLEIYAIKISDSTPRVVWRTQIALSD